MRTRYTRLYAFYILEVGGVIKHYKDDGEHGAGRRLLDLLRDKDIIHYLVCVWKYNGGSDIGQVTFIYILDAGKRILMLLHNM